MHGAVVSSHQLRKKKKCLFFDGAIADDTSKIWLVGFDTLQQKELEEFNERQAVQLTEKRKQNVTISDASGSAKLVLWEEDIDCVRAYIMKNLIVRVYLGSKYLSKGVSTNIQQISDIGIMSSTSSTSDSAEETAEYNSQLLSVFQSWKPTEHASNENHESNQCHPC